jgi:hypothetical protein
MDFCRPETTSSPSINCANRGSCAAAETRPPTRLGMPPGANNLSADWRFSPARQVGIREIFADGSFVEDKDHPNDIDGYFVCDLKSLASGVLAQQLNRLDPYKVWTWDPASRRPYRGYPKRQLPMWHRYRVELYPHVPGLGLGSGIRDKFGHELEFPSAFRQSRRDGKPRGIVKIKYGGPS